MNRNIKQLGLRLALCGVLAVTFGLGFSDTHAGDSELEQATFYVY